MTAGAAGAAGVAGTAGSAQAAGGTPGTGTAGAGGPSATPDGSSGTRATAPSDEPRSWTDRHGTIHRERHPAVPGRDHPVPRVTGPLERAWAETFHQDASTGARSRAALASVVLARRNPLVTDVDEGHPGSDRGSGAGDVPGTEGSAGREGPAPRRDASARLDSSARRDASGRRDFSGRGECLYTWIVEAPGATTVLLWANALFDHRDVAASEFTHLEGSDLWTLTLRLPRSWRASYRIAVWDQDAPPPWRTAQGRRRIRLAALEAGGPDPRGGELIEPREGLAASVASGPDAPADPWPTAAREGLRREARGGGFPHGQVREMTFPAGPTYGEQRVWVYCPPGASPDAAPGTPLLILFDGQVWARGLHLPDLLDAAIGAGAVAPLHVAMVDSHEESRRWDELGVPTAQVDFVLDVLLPRLRAILPLDTRGTSTLVSGQSFGGLAALWTVALGDGEVGRALAQSPSLWRFDLAGPLLGEPAWRSLRIRSGAFEGSMLEDAHSLAALLGEDPRLAGRSVDVGGVEGGHDWAWWRQDLLAALEDALPATPGL